MDIKGKVCKKLRLNFQSDFFLYNLEQGVLKPFCAPALPIALCSVVVDDKLCSITY